MQFPCWNRYVISGIHWVSDEVIVLISHIDLDKLGLLQLLLAATTYITSVAKLSAEYIPMAFIDKQIWYSPAYKLLPPSKPYPTGETCSKP